MAGAAVTARRPADRTGGAGPPSTSAAHSPAAEPPPASLGVEPAAEPVDETFVAREESAAAAEAATIGGVVPHDAEDPAMDPVYQAGAARRKASS